MNTNLKTSVKDSTQGIKRFMKSMRWVKIAIITCFLLLCILLCIGSFTGEFIATHILKIFTPIPILEAVLVIGFIVALACAIMLSLSQKRISIEAVVFLLIGLLFLASAILEDGDRVLTQNMSLLEDPQLSTVLQYQHIRSIILNIKLGILNVNIGILNVFIGFININSKRAIKINPWFKPTRGMRIAGVFSLICGIFSLSLGFYLLINQFFPSWIHGMFTTP